MDGDDSEIGQGSRDPLNALVLRPKNTRLQRMAPFIIVTSLLLFSGIVALLVTLGRGGECHLFPQEEVEKQTDNSSTGVSEETSPISQYQHPSAMLTGGNSSNGKYLLWMDNLGVAYCHGGFKYSNGDLVVPKQGIYRVFLQITYTIPDEKNSDHDSEAEMTLWNKVLLYSDNYMMDRLLLYSVDTVRRSKQPRHKSMYTSGLFSLYPNDRLRVISSHPKFIVKNEPELFFGAELLPQ